MSNKIIVDQKYLESINYHEFKDVLPTLGLGAAWKSGKSKVDVIKDALSLYAKIQKLKGEGVTKDEDLEEKLKLAAAQEIKDQENKLAEEKLKEQEEIAKNVSQIVEKKLTPEQFKRKLEVIDMNLKTATILQRSILLKKRTEVIAAMEK